MTPPRLNEQLCKHAYYETTERIARLACFATARSIEKIGFGEYCILSEELAKKDLIILSISLRRLSELTSSQGNLKSENIKIMKKSKSKNYSEHSDSCWNLIGNLIHGQEITITKEIPGKISDDILEMIQNTIEIDALISIKSDKFERKIFSAVDFIKAVNNYMETAESILSDSKIFVGSLYQ